MSHFANLVRSQDQDLVGGYRLSKGANPHEEKEMGTPTETTRRGQEELRRRDTRGHTVIESRWSPDHKWVEIWSGPSGQAEAVWTELTEGGE